MIIDFHTHSHASDGALAPHELLAEAAAAGIEQFALTDHDTVAGYRSLLDGGSLPVGIRLLPGAELSSLWSGVGVHVVGLGMDIEHPELVAGLARLDAARRERAVLIAERLDKLDMPGALEGARAEAGISQIGRPHFAAWMVAEGHARDANQAFGKYLGAGKVGDVKTCWPTMAEAVGWIVAAGGTAVLAHPFKYKMTRVKLKRCIADFQAAGGTAIEVYSGRQTREQTLDLCEIANEFRLMASAGSDFHAHWDHGPRLGFDSCHLPIAVELLSAEQLEAV